MIPFDKFAIRKKITTIKFFFFDKSRNAVVAVRTHIPLTITYALTIHKCQGMDIESAVFDCTLVKRPGQSSVATSHAMCHETSTRGFWFHANITNKYACEQLFCISLHDEPVSVGFPWCRKWWMFICCRASPFELDWDAFDTCLKINTFTDIQCNCPEDFTRCSHWKS